MRRVALAVVVLAVAGCGQQEPPPPQPAATPDPCHRPATPLPAPDGLAPPAGTLVSAVHEAPPNKKVEGFIPLSPDQFVARMERRKGTAILFKESEGTDAEVLATDGRHRSFWKLVRVCADGSRFSALTGAELAPAAAKGAAKTK